MNPHNYVFPVGVTEFSFLSMVMSLCVDVMVMSSAIAVSFTGACGVGVSDVYILNGVDDRTPPCANQF